MARSPFLVTITDLSTPGDRRSDRVSATVDWSLDLVRVLPGEPLAADLDFQRMSGGLLVTGTVTALVETTCHRCLDRSTHVTEIPVAARFLDDPDDEAYQLDPSELDLEQMLRDETLLGLPLLPVCGPDCPGVVSSTQADLNTIPSSDDESDSASPFAVLRDFLETDQ